MPDTQTAQDEKQVQYAQSDTRPQVTFDSLFSEQMLPGIDTSGKEYARAYWNLAQATLQTAREVTEMQLFASMQRQIVAQTTQQVIGHLQANPHLIAPIVKQAFASQSSPTRS